jgi:cystathionine gamma-synthase
MAAAAALVQAAVKPGEAVLAPKVMYWGLRDWLIDFGAAWGVSVEFFDTADSTDLARKLRPGVTRLVWIETPCNPNWDIIDIRAAADAAHAAGALLAVDSTVATPVLTRPIEHGADFVMHSATKYLNGHGDVVAGALATAGDNDTWQRVLQQRAYAGAIPGAFEAWLLQRGMRTLFLRVHRASETALALARHLQHQCRRAQPHDCDGSVRGQVHGIDLEQERCHQVGHQARGGAEPDRNANAGPGPRRGGFLGDDGNGAIV